MSKPVPGFILETPNGNRYLTLPDGRYAYIGNKELVRSAGLLAKDALTADDSKVIGKVTLPDYD